MDDLKKKDLPWVHITWPQALTGDSSEGIVQVLLLTKDWEVWRRTFAQVVLHEPWQDLPCLRRYALRDAIEDVSLPSWERYPAPTPESAYSRSREKKTYALAPRCRFWKELIGMEVYILGVDTERLFTHPYLCTVVAQDVGETPATFRGHWFFIDKSNSRHWCAG